VAVNKRNGMSRHGQNGHGSHDLQVRLKSLRGDIGALQNDVAGLVGDVGDAASSRVQYAMSGAMKTAREASGRVESWGNENMHGLRKMVRSQPFTACAVAIGAGALLGFILRR